MLFLSVTNVEESLLHRSSALELRLDLFWRIELDSIREILQTAGRPVLLTLRRTSHGGSFQGSEAEREGLIQKLLSLKPHFFDLEYDMRPAFLNTVLNNHPETQFILSYHNFQETPSNLEEIYQNMKREAVYSYKIAAMAHSTNDALRLLNFRKRDAKISAICMGERGSFARILGPIVGNRLNYASIDSERKTAPGQISCSDYPLEDTQTAIYGLIGDPVAQSRGDLHHNAFFREQNRNALYVKMAVKVEEIPEFLSLAKELGIRGLSVTMPLKEAIVPFLDEVDARAKEMGAVNTLLFMDGKIFGTNTDGWGALDAIERRGRVRGKKIVLLGAGGCARAIAFEAHARGAEIVILNRTRRRAEELAAALGCQAGGLGEVPAAYDLLINCTPCGMPIDPLKIRPNTLVMDVVSSPRKTPFLKEAALRGCHVIEGEEMFLNQAAGQSAFWTNLCATSM